MSTRERMFLTCYEKWKKYRRVPWKFFLNLILAALTTAQVRDNVVSSYDFHLLMCELRARPDWHLLSPNQWVLS